MHINKGAKSQALPRVKSSLKIFTTGTKPVLCKKKVKLAYLRIRHGKPAKQSATKSKQASSSLTIKAKPTRPPLYAPTTKPKATSRPGKKQKHSNLVHYHKTVLGTVFDSSQKGKCN